MGAGNGSTSDNFIQSYTNEPKVLCMLKHYATLLFLATCLNLTLEAQVVTIDSVLYQDQEITLVYTLSDSLPNFQYQVDIFGLFGGDTISLADGRNYPTDSLTAGTYRMRWNPIRALGRYRGNARFGIIARPGFRVMKGPETSYKLGQSATLSWYGGNTINDQFDIELLQFGTIVQTQEVQYGLLSSEFQFSEELKPGEGYTLRLTARSSGLTWESNPFILTRIKERKWYLYAIPAAVVSGLAAWLILSGPLDPPDDLPE